MHENSIQMMKTISKMSENSHVGGAREASATHLNVFDHFGIVSHLFDIVSMHWAIVFVHFGSPVMGAGAGAFLK